MEAAATSGNTLRLFKLMRDTGGRRNLVNEIMCDRNGEPSRGKWQRLDHWAEEFKVHFSSGQVNVVGPISAAVNPRKASLDFQHTWKQSGIFDF